MALLGIDTKTVGDIASISGGFPPFHIPQIPLAWETLVIIFPYAAIVAGVGLIESLLTLNIVDEITETRGYSNREAVAQGSANILSGLFSGMGGCAMIGQSLINFSSVAWARLSGIVAALMLLVTLVTVFLHNLALAIVIGVIIAALVFAWDNAKRIRARKYVDEEGVKHYEIYGPLFFASVAAFNEKFDVMNDPDEVIIDFAESRVADMSAIEALNRLTERYLKQGKRIHLKHLSADCRRLLKNAEDIIDMNVIEDPTYKIPSGKIYK